MTETTAEPTELDSLYSERAHLVALLMKDYKGSYKEDPEEEGWMIVYADIPTGQVSWHIAPADRHLFENLRFAPDIEWDWHTTDAKYARVREAIGAGR
jgi:hypothetical protein